ncbi:thiol:disulfide interchange protein [Winogradskyella sp. J14-2]|uniref:TlpA family protein disulfide reductase n=1 Tax=Winogradskyella sp. J14-2 TaxID=1936080 RepID=UPI0009728872|nr:TlpA disulfide reductase family protein [Winogradskyella sp. J14-2]APY07919.1 thiol:disulfide interchange protein [Winogradskyella sp. J14-2]
MKYLFAAFFISISLLMHSQEFPDINLNNLDGNSISVKALADSSDIKIFSFWATWCVPCINELDAIADVYEDWQDETNVELIAVSTDDARTKKRVIPLVNGKGWEYQILLDENQDLKRALNINVLPYVVVVKNGEIIHTRTGYTPGSEEELYEVVKEHSK